MEKDLLENITEGEIEVSVGRLHALLHVLDQLEAKIAMEKAKPGLPERMRRTLHWAQAFHPPAFQAIRSVDPREISHAIDQMIKAFCLLIVWLPPAGIEEVHKQIDEHLTTLRGMFSR